MCGVCKCVNVCGVCEHVWCVRICVVCVNVCGVCVNVYGVCGVCECLRRGWCMCERVWCVCEGDSKINNLQVCDIVTHHF